MLANPVVRSLIFGVCKMYHFVVPVTYYRHDPLFQGTFPPLSSSFY